MISVCFQGKPFNIMVIQAYAPTSNAEEAEIEQIYEDLQDLLELTSKKLVFFYHGGLGCNSRKSRDISTNRQVWPRSTKWSSSKANRVLPRECTGHSKHQMVNTEIRLIIFFAAKDGEAVYSQQNKTQSWLWLRSWTPYCQIQTKKKVGKTTRLLR